MSINGQNTDGSLVSFAKSPAKGLRPLGRTVSVRCGQMLVLDEWNDRGSTTVGGLHLPGRRRSYRETELLSMTELPLE